MFLPGSSLREGCGDTVRCVVSGLGFRGPGSQFRHLLLSTSASHLALQGLGFETQAVGKMLVLGPAYSPGALWGPGDGVNHFTASTQVLTAGCWQPSLTPLMNCFLSQ